MRLVDYIEYHANNRVEGNNRRTEGIRTDGTHTGGTRMGGTRTEGTRTEAGVEGAIVRPFVRVETARKVYVSTYSGI